MSCVVIGELDDECPLVFRERRGDLLDQLLLSLNVHRRKQLVFVNRLEQLLVLVLALFLRVGKRWQMAPLPFELQLRRTAVRKLEQFL